jgi:hypothetical protein
MESVVVVAYAIAMPDGVIATATALHYLAPMIAQVKANVCVVNACVMQGILGMTVHAILRRRVLMAVVMVHAYAVNVCVILTTQATHVCVTMYHARVIALKMTTMERATVVNVIVSMAGVE